MRLPKLSFIAGLLLAAFLMPKDAAAQPYADPGTGVGLLGYSARTPDAAGSTFTGGAHVLVRLTGVLGADLYTGYRSDEYEEDGVKVLRVKQVPVQLSAIGYLLPNLKVQPYLLGGGGYYRIWATHVGPREAQGRTIENKFAFHAGAGVDVRTGRRFSVRAEGRYVFLDVGPVTELGKSANGWQAGAGFNVYF
jgi:opacity protein-like surface antigen